MAATAGLIFPSLLLFLGSTGFDSLLAVTLFTSAADRFTDTLPGVFFRITVFLVSRTLGFLGFLALVRLLVAGFFAVSCLVAGFAAFGCLVVGVSDSLAAAAFVTFFLFATLFTGALAFTGFLLEVLAAAVDLAPSDLVLFLPPVLVVGFGFVSNSSYSVASVMSSYEARVVQLVASVESASSSS